MLYESSCNKRLLKNADKKQSLTQRENNSQKFLKRFVLHSCWLPFMYLFLYRALFLDGLYGCFS